MSRLSLHREQSNGQEHSGKKEGCFLSVLLTILMLLTSCYRQIAPRYPDCWTYVMCIRHAERDIAVSCLNAYFDRLSSLPRKQQE